MFDGIWEPQGAEFSGEPVPAPQHRMSILGGRYTMTHADGSRDEGRIDIVTASAPEAAMHEADIVCETGAGSGRILRAIMRRRGNLLQLCYHAEDNAPRPAAFVTQRGSLSVLVRYRRIAD